MALKDRFLLLLEVLMMSQNTEIKARYEAIQSELQAIAKNLNITPSKLKARYFLAVVYEQADASSLEDFQSRCKTKQEPKLVDIERLTPILNYARTLIDQEPPHEHQNKENVQFAYTMHVALQSRFLCADIKESVGCIKTAGESLRDLFTTYRRLTESYGYKAQHAGELVKSFLDREIRPFTTKWHQIILSMSNQALVEQKDSFIEELEPISKAANAFCLKLKEDYCF